MNRAGNLLLDASVIIDHFRGDLTVGRTLEAAETILVSVIVLGELYFGALRSSQFEKRMEQMEVFLRTAVIVGTDQQTSITYARIRAALAIAGTPIPENDIWIAAIAVQHNVPVVTSDQHFHWISGLRIVSP